MRRYFFSFILLLFGTIYALAATEYEYWLDDDYANRITGIIESSAQSFEIDVSKLQPGIHYLTYRAKANSTEWGAITRSMFYMADIQEPAHATLLEYWLDNDYNNRQSVSANDGAMSISQHLDALQPGIHYFNIRLKGDTEQWGTICRHMMYIYEADPDDPCTLTEWWFDNNYKDRQTDNTGQTQISLTESVAHMQPGIHYFNIRSQGQSGRWGATSRYMFYLYDQPKETTATAVNYWIDGDYAQKQTISLDNGHAVMLVDLGLISTGKHMFNMECITDSGETCLLSSVSFKVGIEDILPWGTEEPWESKYIPNGSRDNYTEPAADVNGKGWTELSFDDSAWQTLTGPIANNTDIIEPVNFNWPNEVEGLNLRRTFTMDSVPNGKYQLLMKHDDAVRVYLNNQLVVESYDCGTDFVYDIPSTALQVGENILAIYIDQFGGNNYLDYCLQYLSQQAEPEPYAVLSEDDTILTFYYDMEKQTHGGMDIGPFGGDSDYPAWYAQRDRITTAIFDPSFANSTTITSTAYWFYECSKLSKIEGIENLKTDNVTDMSYMFRGCSSLESLDVSEFKTDKVMNMQGMFYGCYGLASLDLSNFNTANVTDVGEMFCYSSGLMSLNVSGFNTANMTNMGGMFKFCSGLTSLDVSSFNTVNVTSMKDMFYGCSGLTSLDVSSFNTNNVTVMEEMFSDCSSLTTIYVGEGWSTEKVTNGKDVFFGCTNLVGGAGTFYDANHTNYTYAHIDGGVDNPGYFTQSGSEPYNKENYATYENYVLTVEGDMSMAQALEQVGGHDVVANDIAAIVWNSTQALTSSDIESFGNPNLLMYVQTDSLAPEGVNNVVINGKAKNIILVDAEGNNNFWAPQAFTAEEISYTRNFQQQTQVGVSRGWEGICLPFTVESYTHENHGTIAPFHNNASNYHFWLHQMTDQGMDNATTIEANKPYIISMPNSDAYPEAYNQAGKVTFAASNATVPASDNSAYWSPDGSIALMSTYLRIEPSEYIYALNVGNAIESYAEGSVFVKNYRDVRPFEVYTFHESHHHNGAGARTISISSLFGGEGTTGIIDVIAEPNSDRWYDMNGRRLQSKPVRKGIYIKNGKKVVIK